MKVEVNGKQKFSFKVNKALTAIGSNNRSKYYKLLSGNMEKNGIIPDYEGEDFKEKFDNFILTFKRLTEIFWKLQTVTSGILEKRRKKS